MRSALLKLSAALPAARRDDEAQVRQRFYLDSAWWRQGEEPVAHLPALHEAVWQDRQVWLAYRIEPLGIDITQMVDPFALVVKAGVWHLVAAVQGALRVYPLAMLSEARLAEGHFQRPADFDLEAFWRAWCSDQEQGRASFTATVRVAPGDAGWTTVSLPFESLEAARERILSFGGGVEVLEPPALRWSVQDFAAQIVALYGG